MTGPAATRCRTRVLIADDHVVVAEGLRLAMATRFEVVGMVHELEQIVYTITATKPDVLLLDLSFGGASSLPLLRKITESKDIQVHVVVLTAHQSGTLLQAAKEAGAVSTLLKGVSTIELLWAIEAAAEGRGFVSRETPATCGQPARGRRSEIDGALFTDRQLQVLLMLAEGHSRATIVQELGITAKGVDFTLRKIKDAVGFKGLAQIVVWGVEHRDAIKNAVTKGLKPPEE